MIMSKESGSSSVRAFGMKDKIGYMMGDPGNDFTFIFASSYVMVFYSKVMGISTGVIGTMFLIARCLDAFTDIGMGRLVDISKPSKDGKFRCWLHRMCGPVAVASFLMYQSFLQDQSMTVKIAYMFVTYILWGSVFYTSINIPYGSMASVISDEPKHRSSLSVFRSLGSMLAMIIITVVSPLVVYYTDADGNQVVHAGHFRLLWKCKSIIRIFHPCASCNTDPAWSIHTDHHKIRQERKLNRMLLNRRYYLLSDLYPEYKKCMGIYWNCLHCNPCKTVFQYAGLRTGYRCHR